ncbi:DUF6382 domain-containing protein [Paenibacillus sp. UMB7766-LJ446]|uniref:DUF6382 domain-containing protein n=1 Tax=Paenibacillus sp. UMB7766-LJ446 TaxID=3046313 RepID=UPI0025518C41|nr:DUF6382 domain-containing protein [Paenibacillus sp. UMB7766-LJ446]MDK8189352.1 DUF6382 domain-containing protein [Paenibacillus sp. UMB7766-LJ446]
MYGLTRDFIRNGGSFMVLEKAEGLRMDELSRVQMGMLSSNQIPRLLPVHIREVDRIVTLQYDISGYKMLPQMLKSGKIKLRVLYGLLFQLADTFTECRQYMLDSRKLQIQEEYIFINGSLEMGELGLVYIPIVDAVEVDPTPQQFRELVIRLMAHVQELQGEGIQRVLQLCDSEQWDIRQLRELLLELYADEQNGSGSGQASFMSSRGSFGSTDSELGMPISAIPERGNEPFSKRSGQDQYRQSDGNSEAEQQLKSFQQPRVTTIEDDKPLNKPFSGFSGRRSPIESSLQSKGVTNPSQRQTFDSLQDDDMEKDEKQASSKMTYILLGCMIAMALVWRFIYMEQPGQTQMILSAALSAGLLGIAGWAWVTKGKFENSKSNLLRKKIPNEEYADGELQEGSSNKRSALFGLGRGKDKQESEEEMFQESWRWNASEMSPEGNANAQGYTSQQRSGDMQSQSAQSERRHSFESRSSVEDNSRFQNLHIPSEASEEPFVQHAIEATAATSELIHHHAAADATVNLQSVAGGITGAGPVIPSFYLERRSATGDKNERMDVRGASFVIGRSADMVQWVDSSTGVSRAHVELSRNKSGYVIKDLGSVNGTILKGNVLAPYKEYPLEDGDTFTLAESVYTYRSVG